FLHRRYEFHCGGFLCRVGILAVDQAETAIDRFHFVVERRIFPSLRKRSERQKESKRENDKSIALERCFHKDNPIDAPINCPICGLKQEQKIRPLRLLTRVILEDNRS